MVRAMFDPDDFTGNPYGGGANQLGHVVLGAAIVGTLISVMSLVWGIWLALLMVMAWELWQREYRGATLLDTKADLTYWSIGVVWWGVACWLGELQWWVACAPWVPCLTPCSELPRKTRATANRKVATRFSFSAKTVTIAAHMQSTGGRNGYTRQPGV